MQNAPAWPGRWRAATRPRSTYPEDRLGTPRAQILATRRNPRYSCAFPVPSS